MWRAALDADGVFVQCVACHVSGVVPARNDHGQAQNDIQQSCTDVDEPCTYVVAALGTGYCHIDSEDGPEDGGPLYQIGHYAICRDHFLQESCEMSAWRECGK